MRLIPENDSAPQTPRPPSALMNAGLWVACVCALGLWLAVETGRIVAWNPTGGRGGPWCWLLLTGQRVAPLEIVALGLLAAGAIWAAARVAARVTGDKPAGKRLAPVPGIALPLAALWCAAIAAQRVQLPGGATAATQAVLLGGRITGLLIVWQVLDLEKVAAALAPRNPQIVRALLAVLPVAVPLLMRGVPIPMTGDEPSYAHMAASMADDLDLKFSGAECQRVNKALNIDVRLVPHLWERPGGLFFPVHFIGTSLAAIPAYAVGRILGGLDGIFRLYLLALHGLNLALAGLLALRLTRRPGAALAATAILGVSFPCIAMSYQLYPEPFVTLLVLLGFHALSPGLEGRPLPPRNSAAVLAVCIVLPWFHPKYSLYAAALAGMAWWYGRPWRLRTVVVASACVLIGAAAFLAFHVPVHGPVLWKQNDPYFSLNGLAGMMTDSENGLLPFVPWILLLPVGGAVLARKKGGWRPTVAFLLILVPLTTVTAFSTTWNDGGTSAIRYFMPPLAIALPLLAAAVSAGRGRRLAGALLAAVPVLAALVFLRDPVSGYGTGGQVNRTVLDAALGAFSWRELFPQFGYRGTGVAAPGALAHAGIVLALAGTVAALMAGARLSPRRLAWTGAGAALLLPFLANAFAPNAEGVTGAGMFEAQVTRMGWLERHRAKSLRAAFARIRLDSDKVPRARLVLSAAFKPVECLAKRDARADGTLVFSPESSGPLVGGKLANLPRGYYRLSVSGTASSSPGTTTSHTLSARLKHDHLAPDQTGSGQAGTARWSLAAEGPAAAPWLVEMPFCITDGPALLDLTLGRDGNTTLTLETVGIEYLGRDTIPGGVQ